MEWRIPSKAWLWPCFAFGVYQACREHHISLQWLHAALPTWTTWLRSEQPLWARFPEEHLPRKAPGKGSCCGISTWRLARVATLQEHSKLDNNVPFASFLERAQLVCLPRSQGCPPQLTSPVRARSVHGCQPRSHERRPSPRGAGASLSGCLTWEVTGGGPHPLGWEGRPLLQGAARGHTGPLSLFLAFAVVFFFFFNLSLFFYTSPMCRALRGLCCLFWNHSPSRQLGAFSLGHRMCHQGFPLSLPCIYVLADLCVGGKRLFLTCYKPLFTRFFLPTSLTSPTHTHQRHLLYSGEGQGSLGDLIRQLKGFRS